MRLEFSVVSCGCAVDAVPRRTLRQRDVVGCGCDGVDMKRCLGNGYTRWAAIAFAVAVRAVIFGTCFCDLRFIEGYCFVQFVGINMGTSEGLLVSGVESQDGWEGVTFLKRFRVASVPRSSGAPVVICGGLGRMFYWKASFEVEALC